jgi:hypothetical protein
MKFMVNSSVDQDKWLPILEQWRPMIANQHFDTGPGVSIVDLWHDTGGRSGVAIIDGLGPICPEQLSKTMPPSYGHRHYARAR